MFSITTSSILFVCLVVVSIKLPTANLDIQVTRDHEIWFYFIFYLRHPSSRMLNATTPRQTFMLYIIMVVYSFYLSRAPSIVKVILVDFDLAPLEMAAKCQDAEIRRVRFPSSPWLRGWHLNLVRKLNVPHGQIWTLEWGGVGWERSSNPAVSAAEPFGV